MRAQDLQLDELIAFDEGTLSLQGRRVVLHDMHAMARFRKDLVTATGQEHARSILTRFGFYWGQNDAPQCAEFSSGRISKSFYGRAKVQPRRCHEGSRTIARIQQ